MLSYFNGGCQTQCDSGVTIKCHGAAHNSRLGPEYINTDTDTTHCAGYGGTFDTLLTAGVRQEFWIFHDVTYLCRVPAPKATK